VTSEKSGFELIEFEEAVK
jgi:hypothetical protein